METDNNNSTKDAALLLKGRWRNELGSVMIIRKVETSTFEADYCTAVGNAKAGNAIGTYSYMNDLKKIVLSFSITWTNVQDGKDKSSTSWSGVIYPKDDQSDYDGPVLYTTWTLTSKGALWANTNTGKDRFVKESEQGNSTFNLRNFQYNLKTKEFGRSLVYRRSTETTMDIANREISEGANSGTLVLADEQTKGVASKENRTWSSKLGNLFISLVVENEKLIMLLHVSAVAVALTCRDYGVPAEIKWPNDVWVNGRKLSGMICRTATRNGYHVFNLGVGININREMLQEENIKAISVREYLGRVVDREKFLADYLLKLEGALNMSDEEFFKTYQELSLLKPGNKIQVFPEGFEKPGKTAEVVSYTPKFYTLNVKYDDGKTEELVASEVSTLSVRPHDNGNAN